ncbi:hypothetical protein KJ934_03080 [Patescibacteria group bacterium]|nr:hypothetical protein [Patescibacteria group bacterium]MBU4353241.1 hypothetical protein [Patescibacteria group bacterium]MBU4477137.1 hypothetical protein [Patescibacteria group bacterium]MCG2698934.1 hypothetical protein [Candidatus Parcubacteria bacterium]
MGSGDNLSEIKQEFKEEIKKRLLKQSYVSSKEEWYLEFVKKLKMRHGMSDEEINDMTLMVYEEFLEKNIPEGFTNLI